MEMRRGRRTGAGLGALALVAAIGASGCGSTTGIDPTKAENAIRQSVAAKGNRIDSVNCPSGVTAKAGTTFDCTLTATLASGFHVSGTVTLHITSASGGVDINSSDYHLTPDGGSTPSPPSTTTT